MEKFRKELGLPVRHADEFFRGMAGHILSLLLDAPCTLNAMHTLFAQELENQGHTFSCVELVK